MRLTASFALILLLTACSRSHPDVVNLGGKTATSRAPQPATPPAGAPRAAPAPVSTDIQSAGTEFAASPNPIVSLNTAGKGQTTLTWKTTRTSSAEIHVDKPDGPLFCKGGGTATCPTGEWVVDGQTFYLQDASVAQPTQPSATLATVTVHFRQTTP